MKRVFLITNNKKGFYSFCELPFLTAEEFLQQFNFQQ